MHKQFCWYKAYHFTSVFSQHQTFVIDCSCKYSWQVSGIQANVSGTACLVRYASRMGSRKLLFPHAHTRNMRMLVRDMAKESTFRLKAVSVNQRGDCCEMICKCGGNEFTIMLDALEERRKKNTLALNLISYVCFSFSFQLIVEINSQVALFRDLLIHIGQSKDCPELREKVRKTRRACVETLKHTSQLILPQLKT